MAVLAGIDYIDIVFTEFVSALDGIVRNGKSRKKNPPYLVAIMLI